MITLRRLQVPIGTHNATFGFILSEDEKPIALLTEALDPDLISILEQKIENNRTERPTY